MRALDASRVKTLANPSLTTDRCDFRFWQILFGIEIGANVDGRPFLPSTANFLPVTLGTDLKAALKQPP